MREQAAPFLTPQSSDPTHSRLIDPRDQSLWPAEDTGYRFKKRDRELIDAGNRSVELAAVITALL